MMRRATWILLAMLAALPAVVQARDERLFFPIEDVYANEDLKRKINPEIKLFFGKQEFPQPEESLSLYTTSKKTNFFNKSDKEACEIAFTSAVIALQERALELGGNAVVSIRNIYRKDHFISEKEYECGAGNVIGGVSLQGEIVRLP